MEYKDIPDHIRFKGLTEEPDTVDIGYSFQGRNKIIRVERNDSDERWVFLMEKTVSHWRAFNVIIRAEEDEWEKAHAKSLVKKSGLFETLGNALNPRNND